MEKISLASVPNQTLSITLGEHLFEIAVLLGQSNSTLIDVSVEGEVLLKGARCVHGADILLDPLPLKYGHLVFLCDDAASYPFYEQFGIKHNLFWWPA